MERVGHLAHRWRYGVVAVEAMLAAGCLYFGLKVLGPSVSTAAIRVHHTTAPAGTSGADVPGAVALQTARPGSLPSGAAHAAPKRALSAPNLSADWLSRLNADGYDQYRGQWQTLQLLMSGVRQYLEQRVVPRLLGH